MNEAMDLLHEHEAKIEKMVFFETASLFNLDKDSIFYDLCVFLAIIIKKFS
jgi:hypothetical protein